LGCADFGFVVRKEGAFGAGLALGILFSGEQLSRIAIT
jgi:hypothetical protein